MPFEGPAFHLEPRVTSAGRLVVAVEGGDCPVLLRPGASLRVELDDGVFLELEVVRERRLAREPLLGGDVRLLVVTGALVLFGMWWDTTQRWANHHPEVIAELDALTAIWSRPVAEEELPAPTDPAPELLPVTFE